MKVWQGIGFLSLTAALAGCGQHGPVQCQVRLWLGVLGAKYGCRLPLDDKLVYWPVRHTGWQIARFQVQSTSMRDP